MTQPLPHSVRRTRYEFLIEGSMSDRAVAAFPDLAEAPVPAPYTTLYGPVDDPTVLRGMLARFDAMGLRVVEMRRLPD